MGSARGIGIGLTVTMTVVLGGCGSRPATGLHAAAPHRQRATTVPAVAPGAVIPDSAFRVAPPILVAQSGGIPLQQRACRPADITAAAALRMTANGVVGIVDLSGDHCSLRIDPGPTALLDTRGRPLAIPLRDDQPAANPARNQRPDLAFGAGHAVWGFWWVGSWCGPRPTAVRIPLRDEPGVGAGTSYGNLDVPLSGAVLPCHGGSNAVLIPGVPAPPSGAALTAPPTWAALTARLSLPASIDSHRLTGMVVTLHNSSSRAVALAPCPDYTLVISAAVSSGTAYQSGTAALSCPTPSSTIPAGGELRIPLQDHQFNAGDAVQQAKPATAVTVQFAISGVPTATAATHVR